MSVWDDVVGQPGATATLKQAAAPHGSLTHAWLITGPPGSGRSTAAIAFAAALNCAHRSTDPSSPEPGCGQCHACQTILAGTHADVTRVRTDKLSISKDEVRSLVQVAQRSPSSGEFRVLIVEDADRMSAGTFNVLLKSIEEPPPKTIWILCAPSPQDLAPTIRSRCRVVTLSLPSPHDVTELLIRRDGIDPELATVAARAAQGHIGLARRFAMHPDALARRDAVVRIPWELRGVGSAVLRAARLVEEATAEAKETSEHAARIERERFLRSAGIEGSTVPPALRSQLKQLEDDQKKRQTRLVRDVLDRTLLDLFSVYRDILMIQLGSGSELVNVALSDDIARYAADTEARDTLAALDAITQTRERITANVPPLLAAEALLARLAAR
ncbi:DNA polymerase III subunit delta' [Devriesea agamarum]|uniref:DNA polymerase III subunit delta' n=1 Tax=Devriesea agamarum TaxID=472569 RepID=UPI00071CB94B|nr:DNA polymerase III subunit delta' [Devriesea agamarum]